MKEKQKQKNSSKNEFKKKKIYINNKLKIIIYNNIIKKNFI